jgi:hypothetical protein
MLPVKVNKIVSYVNDCKGNDNIYQCIISTSPCNSLEVRLRYSIRQNPQAQASPSLRKKFVAISFYCAPNALPCQGLSAALSAAVKVQTKVKAQTEVEAQTEVPRQKSRPRRRNKCHQNVLQDSGDGD